MQVCFTGSAQPVICCETVRRQNKTVQEATLRCWQATANAEHGNFVDSQSHRECIAIKAHFISPSQFSRLVEKYQLIRSLWNQIQPRAIILLNPSLPRHLVSWHVFNIRGAWIHSVIGWLIIAITVSTVSRGTGSCSLI